MDLGLKGKNALITGSTKGLGKTIAELLAAEGANVIITGRRESATKAIAGQISKTYGVKAYGIAADLLANDQPEKLFKESLEAVGHLDILVNNAAVWMQAYVVDMPKEDFEETMYLNLEVPFLLSKYMVGHLTEENRSGKILQVVSQAAFHGSTTGHAHYAASKAGLVSFSVSLAREVAKQGINVNLIAPGMMKTDMCREAIEKNESYYNNRIPMGYVAEAEDVAYAAVFLVSEKANYLTGITLDASGGMLMR